MYEIIFPLILIISLVTLCIALVTFAYTTNAKVRVRVVVRFKKNKKVSYIKVKIFIYDILVYKKIIMVNLYKNMNFELCTNFKAGLRTINELISKVSS